jgi:hypothetical protein
MLNQNNNPSNEIKLLPKYCQSTKQVLDDADYMGLRHCGGKPSIPWAEMWKAQDECPKTIYYLYGFKAQTADKGECFVAPTPEGSMKQKAKKRKPAPTYCPHCGMSLEDKPEMPKPKTMPEIKPKPAMESQDLFTTKFVQVGKNYVPYRVRVDATL